LVLGGRQGLSQYRKSHLIAKPTLETSVSGYLLPASDGFLQDECASHIPPMSLIIYFGNSTAYTSGTSPLPTPNSPYPILVSGEGRDPDPVLSVERSPDGYLSLNAKVIDDEGRFIVKIERNQFLRNEHFSWYQKRPDNSTLSIFDDRD